MNRYLRKFLHRGLIFGGFGPLILGIVYVILQTTVPDFSLSGGEVCLAVFSLYFLAFLQAGISVFPQVEHWSPVKALLLHFLLLYGAYVGSYLVNTWIPFRWEVILLFTAIFTVGYGTVFLAVTLSLRAVRKRLNEKLK